MTKAVLATARIAAACVLCFVCAGCPCGDYIRVVVLAGHHTAADCRAAIDKVGSNDLTLICPGEEVTVCWQSNTKNGITIDPGLGSFSNIGITYFKPQSSTTVTASAPGSCASPVSVPVTVVSQDTPSTWDGGWDLKCSQITFDIDPLFVSSSIYAKDITATWSPLLTDGNGNPIACGTPPFLNGFQQQDVFGFKIDNPNITVPFSRHLKADGHWQFVITASCPAGIDFVCNRAGSYPFDLTLTCAP
jgi:hypothetical protein